MNSKDLIAITGFVGLMDDNRGTLQSLAPYMGENILANLLTKAKALEVENTPEIRLLKPALVESIEKTIALNNKRRKHMSSLLRVNAQTISAANEVSLLLQRLLTHN